MNTPRARSTSSQPQVPQQQQWVLGAPVLSTVDRSVPAEANPADLALYCTMLGDDALVLAHRLSEWGVRAGLEESASLGEIAHELLGQARVLYGRASEIEPGQDEDQLAYLREPAEFRNVRLVEVDFGPGSGGDFPTTVARLLLFTNWRLALFEELTGSRDAVLATLAARSLHKLAQHRDHAAQWVIKLGDSGPGGPGLMSAGLRRVWPLAAELFVPHPVEARLADAGCGVDPSRVRSRVGQALDETFSIARLRDPVPTEFGEFIRPGGRDGAHTGAMEFLLADLQYLARAGLAGNRLPSRPRDERSFGTETEDE
ncbi:phenylacetate-CoA oxygenase subunit PaaI [Saccharopolyspora rhizosphaerae]|uniref:Phenylacetate-CoA oxygenase subunit PaaI n=1 Tax=Saccharopolyspora rhizosphaerae TaxID=2492662 RepID=A0A426JIQ0_9PSEU|nr:1,2-phenylacetyl-CoA epoxidase subunit PaaC [Saccharopolyspora rhizosphaerae]RRO13045.1 phenylacetate-CoA oxygenase subunit PaaI [Saccharopolyspora rhizosphaerae]